MKILIVEDDVTSRTLMSTLLGELGTADVAVNGKEAVEAFKVAVASGELYDLVCLDIMMPEMSGQDALKEIRNIECENKIAGNDSAKVIMTTALDDSKNIMKAFSSQCEAYLVKPIEKDKLMKEIRDLGLL